MRESADLSIRTDVLAQQEAQHEHMRILIRTTVIAIIWLLCVLGLSQVGDPDGGANIGLGLLLFALLVVVGGAWGAADGARQAYSTVAVTWVVVAVLIGVLVPVVTFLRQSASWRVLISDLAQVAPFITVLIAASALLGALLGRAIGGSSRQTGG